MTVFEFASPTLPFVQLDAYVQLPDQPALVELSADLLSSGTVNASGTSFRELTARAGDRLKVTALPGGIRVTARVLVTDADAAAKMFGQLLNARVFENAEVIDKAGKLPFKFRTPFQEAVQPLRFDLRALAERPELKLSTFWANRKVAVSIRGPLVPGSLRGRLLETTLAPSKVTYARAALEVPLEGRKSSVGSLTWFRHPVPKSVEELATASLAAFVLGIGKESLLYSEVRGRQALTYRQEAGVLVGPKGIQVFAVMMREGNLDELKKATTGPLTKRISSLEEGELERAKVGLSRAVAGVFPVNPLDYAGLGEEDDEAFKAAFCFLEFGEAEAMARFPLLLAKVSLDSVKSALTDLFKTPPVPIPGR